MGRSRVEQWRRKRNEIISLLQSLDDSFIIEVDRRTRHSPRPNGFPTQSMGDGSPSGKGGHNDSTQRAALRLVDGVRISDPQADAAGVIDHHLTQALGCARSIAKAHQLLTHIEEDRTLTTEAGGVGPCRICSHFCRGKKHDRLVSGYCPACKQAWIRYSANHKQPDRQVFERERLRFLGDSPGGVAQEA